MKKNYWLFILIPLFFLLAYTGYTIWFRENIRRCFTQNLENEGNGRYGIEKNGELYYCRLPEIFFGGYNLGISSAMDYIIGQEDPVNEYFHVNIPFRFFSSGWQVNIAMGYKDDNGNICDISFSLDEHMNPVNEKEMSSVQLQKYEELKPRIEKIYQKIYDMWGICNIDEQQGNS